MHLSKFVKSNTGKYIMSILLGLGLATLFRAVCSGNKCKIYQAPDLEEVEDKIYKFNNKCYKMEKTVTTCDKRKKIYNFA